jgi:hypothetical protein
MSDRRLKSNAGTGSIRYEAGSSHLEKNSKAGNIFRYDRDASQSKYRSARQTKHEPITRDWGPTNSISGPREWEPEVLNRSQSLTTRRLQASKRESVLYDPKADLSSYGGGYQPTSRSTYKQATTYRPGPAMSRLDESTTDKRKSVLYDPGVDLTSYGGGYQYTDSPHSGVRRSQTTRDPYRGGSGAPRYESSREPSRQSNTQAKGTSAHGVRFADLAGGSSNPSYMKHSDYFG